MGEWIPFILFIIIVAFCCSLSGNDSSNKKTTRNNRNYSNSRNNSYDYDTNSGRYCEDEFDDDEGTFYGDCSSDVNYGWIGENYK